MSVMLVRRAVLNTFYRTYLMRIIKLVVEQISRQVLQTMAKVDTVNEKKIHTVYHLF